MKKICLIAGSIAISGMMGGLMSACTNDHETAPSHSVSSEAEKNALEAEQAEQELAKLAQLQKQNEPKQAKSGRKPASTAPAKTAKAEPKQKAPRKEYVEAAAKEAKHEAPKAQAKAEVKHEEVAKHESPQATAKKEIAAETTVLAKKPTTVAMNDHKPQAPKASAPSHASKSSVYIVQVGAFRVKDNATKLEGKLKDSGFPVRMKEVNHSKNGLLYVVQFEPTPNKDEADAWRSQVKAKAELDSQLVSRPD